MSPPACTPDLAALRQHWGLWTAMVELFARRSRARRVDPREYQALHRDLLAACRGAAEAAEESRRPFYERLEELARPWLSPRVLERTDRDMLLDLLDRCREAGRELGAVPRGSSTWVIALLGCVAALAALLWGAYRVRGQVLKFTEAAWKAVASAVSELPEWSLPAAVAEAALVVAMHLVLRAGGA